ncbi:MAG: class I SAM-dependent methyltransferase [Planctomycetes bacterium]|nr:class I SAM-dependent methyltransferase [Planctomycetota bacterium]
MTLPSLGELLRLASEHEAPPDLRPAWLASLDNDPAGTYYRYFFEFAKRYRPAVFLEIGTCEGKAAAHAAAGNPEGLVITLDVKEQAKRLTEAIGLPNVVSLVGHSLELPRRLRYLPRLDALFIDADHSFETAGREYALYRSFLRDGGTSFFDDIHLNGDMERFWAAMPDPKAELPGLHQSGFGCAVKDARVRLSGDLAAFASEVNT